MMYFHSGVLMHNYCGVDMKTRLVFTSYCRAIIDTDAPGTRDAATISRLSASGHDLCRRLTRKFASIISFVDTSHH